MWICRPTLTSCLCVCVCVCVCERERERERETSIPCTYNTLECLRNFHVQPGGLGTSSALSLR